MKRQFAFTFVLLLALGFGGSVAFAQEGGGTVEIINPKDGGTVGTNFTVTGTVDGNCELGSEVLLLPQTGNDESGTAYLIYSQPTETATGFTYRINVAEAYKTEGLGELTPAVPPAGSYKLEIYSTSLNCNAPSVGVNLAYSTQPASAPKTKPSLPPQVAQRIATPTPTPSATPSESPALIVTVEEESNTIDPVWVFLAGALIGAALLSLSEVSAVSYLKKHGKGPKK